MGRSFAIVLAALVLAAASALAGLVGERARGSIPAQPVAALAPPTTTSAERDELARLVRVFEQRVRDRADASDHVFLGRLYLELARRTGDLAAYGRARAAFERALELAPELLEARAQLASVHYATHEFAAALALARDVLARDPGNLAALAVVADALLELGRYTEAAEAYGTLAETLPQAAAVDARLARVAFLRGEIDEARELARRAEARARAEGAFGSGLAWYGHFLASLALERGDYDAAAAHEADALAVAPRSHIALAGLARARAAQGRIAEAIELYRRAIAIVPDPESLAALGDLHALRGEMDLARQQYDAVEIVATLAALNRQLYDRQLALFYASHGVKPAEALAIAERSLAARPDVYGHDVHALALHANGRYAEARAASDRALALGTRDARLLYHSALSRLALGEVERGRRELSAALALHPMFDPLRAPRARDLLATLPDGR